MNTLNSSGSFNAIEGSLGLHRLIEAMKHMLAIRMDLGDPAFVHVDKYISDMTSPSFAEKISQKINDSTTCPPEYSMNRYSISKDEFNLSPILLLPRPQKRKIKGRQQGYDLMSVCTYEL